LGGIIDLNILGRPWITKELLFKEISDENIFRYYIKDLQIGRVTNSPLRRDRNPSFGVYYAKKHGELFYNDFKLGSGDCIKFVAELLGISYNKAISQIALDFNLDDKYNIDSSVKPSTVIGTLNKSTESSYSREQKTLNVTFRDWKKYDLDFWKSFGITLSILRAYNVFPIKFLFIDGEVYHVDKYAYAYLEEKDGEITYKIYQPFSKYKWMTNHNRTIHQGYCQLPKTGDILIITKSLKDVMSLCSVMQIPAIAPQCEHVLVKPEVMDEYKSRFKLVVALFDNDPAGITLSFRYKTKYEIPFILIPYRYDCKDFSDLVKKYGTLKSKEIFNEIKSSNR